MQNLHGVRHGECDDREGPSSWIWRKRGASRAIGCSRGGLATKILALSDALGNLVKIVLMPGQRNGITGFKGLITDLYFEALLADKAFDADWLAQEL